MNALITLAWHITKKDLHASRDLIYRRECCSRSCGDTASHRVAAAHDVARSGCDGVGGASSRTALPIHAHAVVRACIVAQLVHADPLAGAEGFWLTRPISRSMLFASKLGTMLLALALPAALAQVAPMIAFGVPLLDVMRLLSEYLLYFAAGLMVVFAGRRAHAERALARGLDRRPSSSCGQSRHS